MVMVWPSDSGHRTAAGGLGGGIASFLGSFERYTAGERLRLDPGARHADGVPPIVLDIISRNITSVIDNMYFVIVVVL